MNFNLIISHITALKKISQATTEYTESHGSTGPEEQSKQRRGLRTARAKEETRKGRKEEKEKEKEDVSLTTKTEVFGGTRSETD